MRKIESLKELEEKKKHLENLKQKISHTKKFYYRIRIVDGIPHVKVSTQMFEKKEKELVASIYKNNYYSAKAWAIREARKRAHDHLGINRSVPLLIIYEYDMEITIISRPNTHNRIKRLGQKKVRLAKKLKEGIRRVERKLKWMMRPKIKK